MLRYWRKLVQRRSQGKRSERLESRGGDLKELKDKVKAFSDKEQALGHDIGGDDLVDQMALEAEEAVWLLEPGEEARNTRLQLLLEKEMFAADKFSKEEKKEMDEIQRQKTLLKACKSFLDAGLSSRQAKLYHKETLLQHCEVVERKPDLVFPMSEAESRLLMKLGWQSFDRLVWCLSQGDESQLKAFVGQPEKFIAGRRDIPIAMTDAVPVYLDVAAGKILVPVSALEASRKRRIAKKRGVEPEELTEDIHIVAEGASRGEKDRLTWICGQVLYNYFTPAEEERKVVGEMLPSILLVQCSTFCRLENICPTTGVFLEDESFSWQGKLVQRKKGEKAPANLLASWRKCRGEHPELFQNAETGERKVLVWGSVNAYQNEVVCSFMSREYEKKWPSGCLHMVDMFSGELTEHMESVNFLRNQVKAVVPPKQTAKAQVTDLLFARIGKAAGSQMKSELRRAQRRKAAKEGVSAKLESGPYECMKILTAMHDRCVEAAAEGAVELTTRKAAWLAYEPFQGGLRKAEGERWSGLPLGGSNLPSKYMELRYTELEGGEPPRPDWSEVHKLRQEARQSAKYDREIKSKGLEKARLGQLEGKKSQMVQNQKEKAAEENELLDYERKAFWTEKDNCLGVLTEYQQQQDIEEEYTAEQKKDCLVLENVDKRVYEDMEKQGEMAWLQLPPKRRREILDEAQTEAVTSQAVSSNLEDQREMRQVTASQISLQGPFLGRQNRNTFPHQARFFQ